MAKKSPVAKAAPAPALVGYLIRTDAAGEEIEDVNAAVEPFAPDLAAIIEEAEENNWDTVIIYEVREIGRLPRPKRELEIF